VGATARRQQQTLEEERSVSKESPRDRLRDLLDLVVTGSGLDLESVDITPAGKRRVVRVVVDKDGGVSLDDVAAVSTAVSAVLDERAASDALGGAPYVLEVTSPGVDRPLTEPRHWRRAAGRLVAATTAEGGELVGRVVSATDDEVVLDVSGRQQTVQLADLGPGKVQVEFARPAGGDDVQDGDDAAAETDEEE
jgi:ribosome maturation factor RimP